MPDSSLDAMASQNRETLAQMLFPVSEPESRRKLEAFRVAYERANGPTDLSKRYTSTWPCEQQEWLIKNYTKQYFDGLPPFAKAWIKGKIEAARGIGKMDDVPDEFLRLFLSGEMRLDSPRRGREPR